MSLTLRTIAEAVAACHGISYIDMITHRRATAKARQTAFWLARNLTDRTLAQIGRAFSRDHTTILHGINQIDQQRAHDTRLAEDLERMKSDLRTLSSALTALRLTEKPESNARDIAERVLATHNGPTGVSMAEIRTLAIAVVTLDAAANNELVELPPAPEPELDPTPPACAAELAAFAEAYRDLENAEYGRGERYAREQFEKATTRLVKAYRPIRDERTSSHG